MSVNTRSPEEGSPNRIEIQYIVQSLKHYAPEMNVIGHYAAGLLKEPSFQEEATKLRGSFSDEIVREGWPWRYREVEELLSQTEDAALELRPKQTPYLSEEQVRFGFALKRLAAKWEFGTTGASIDNMARLATAVGEEGGGFTVFGYGTWEKWRTIEIHLPPWSFGFLVSGKPAWSRVRDLIRKTVEKEARLQFKKSMAEQVGRGRSKLQRDAEWYAMHKAGKNSARMIGEYNERHPEIPEKDRLNSYDPAARDTVRKARKRFKKDLREAQGEFDSRYLEATI